ncbi:hypothetical protein JQ596_23605 [Bradyrhizobium manausense]|uniref:hypothetical protein n=1 Tax=Bradyrhizobium manausense TaxID=989370 RepID=UPI001BA4F2AD|nr:hypothetical protein [Bradyrhizobium manausense]MBR0828527.1 hypothetical protein [Bradyrhizobium manausense]
MDFRSKQIAAPKSWVDFEDLCHAIFRAEWNDPNAQKNGRAGQAQHGVDVFGSPNAIADVFHGVQCKGKDKNYGKKATEKELRQEIKKAEEFSPALRHWVFATSAPKDEKLQRVAREISVARRAKGLFTVTVVGWEDIQYLISRHPGVIQEFYPEHAFDIPGLMASLRDLPSGEDVRELVEETRRLNSAERSKSAVAPAGAWVREAFVESRDLAPALLGRSLGPADASACPRLREVDLVLTALSRAYSARLVGDPGSGKSVCAYQVANDLLAKGWNLFRLRNAAAVQDPFPMPEDDPALLLVDDAHLMDRMTLQRLEEAAGPRRMVLSVLNGTKGTLERGAIMLDSQRAVKTIAAALRADSARTLATVQRIDDDVGAQFLKEPIERRIDDAEQSSDRPWQFCFVLGGGWKRAQEVADAARVAEADLALAAAAMLQIASRDAARSSETLAAFCVSNNLAAESVEQAIGWLSAQRLILSRTDCRCPHQRFAAVVLGRILAGQSKMGRLVIGGMFQAIFQDSQFPLPGLRILLHELRFLGDYYRRWTGLVPPQSLEGLTARCWAANTPEDRAFAAFIFQDLEGYQTDWPTKLLSGRIHDLAEWIVSAQSPMAYGLFHLMNAVRQSDEKVASAIIDAVDPFAVARAVSRVTPQSTSHVAHLIKTIGWERTDKWKTQFDKAFDRRDALRMAAAWPPTESIHSFADFCLAIGIWYPDLGFALVDAFTPTAQQAIVDSPLTAFQDLDDIFSYVLRVFDLFGTYVGRKAPKKRELDAARKLFAKVKANDLAVQLSAAPLRDYQNVTFLLSTLRKAHPAKFNATVVALDWQRIGRTIGTHWSNLPHEAEILLSVVYSNETARKAVDELVLNHATQIEQFSPRVACLSPKAAVAHLDAGKPVRLARHGHCEWKFGAVFMAQIGKDRPDLIEKMVAPIENDLGAILSNQNASWFKEASLFLEVLGEAWPEGLQGILSAIDANKAEAGWVSSLEAGGDPRRTAAFLVESAFSRTDTVGDLARRMRKRFPKASVPVPTKDKRSARRRTKK